MQDKKTEMLTIFSGLSEQNQDTLLQLARTVRENPEKIPELNGLSCGAPSGRNKSGDG